MKAVTLHRGDLDVEDVPEPVPGPGQLLVEVARCGICGSDLHARHTGDELGEVLEIAGYPRYMRSHQRTVMGHEFTGTVVERGPETLGTMSVGTPVVAVPLVRRGRQVDGIGLSESAPGAFAERLLVQEALAFEVPDGLDPDLAALTEPLAVGWHAVARGEVKRGDVAVVIGCGPVGLAVIASLKTRRVSTIVASDPSPGRRALASRLGAHVVVDPTVQPPYEAAAGRGEFGGMEAAYNAAMDAIDGLRKLPVPWWATWRALDAIGVTTPKAPVVFECVGVPGMIDGILGGAPLYSRVVVVGVCMGADRIRPSLAINKELDLRFVVGYHPTEFRATLRALAAGKLDAAPMITGHVGLHGVATAFEALADPETQAKVLINPAVSSSGLLP